METVKPSDIRKTVIEMVFHSQASHVGSCLSIADILYVLYFKVMDVDPANPFKPDRDKFVLSKAHGSAALYATLACRGFITRADLKGYFVDDGILPGHLDKFCVPALEVSAGSLGHGLSIGTGIALANRLDGVKGGVYVLLGDGECNEGSVWEAVMLASSLGLDSMTAIVDFNKLQAFGRTNEVIDQKNMAQRWAAFGWEAVEVDGHDCVALEGALTAPRTPGKPRVVVAHTVKGKGVSFMENSIDWHYKSPKQAQFEQAMAELGAQR